MKVTIEWGPVRSGFNPLLPPALAALVDSNISVFVPGYKFSKQYKARVWNATKTEKVRLWDGKKHFLWPKRQRFPTGLLHMVKEALEAAGNEVNISGEAPMPDHILPVTSLPDGSKLRDYQIAACSAFLDSPRGILRLPTASGKTLVAAAITRSMNCQTLGLIHGNSLLDQTHADFERHLRQKIGLIGNKVFDPQMITLASVDTVYSALKRNTPAVLEVLGTTDFVWCDETHRASAMSWVEVLKAIETPYRLGLSGTPFKKQELRDMELQAWTGPLLYNIDPKQLQDTGFLAPARLTAVEINSPKSSEKDYQTVVKELIIEHEERNTVLADLAIARAKAGKSVFLLAGNSIALSLWLFRYIEELFPGVELVTGQTGVYANRDALKRFSEGASRIIVSSVVMDEGINAPNTNVVILAYTGKSYVKTIQRIGRGLRLKSDGSGLEVIDVMDNTNFFLRNHAKKRLEYYEEEGFFSSVEVINGVA